MRSAAFVILVSMFFVLSAQESSPQLAETLKVAKNATERKIDSRLLLALLHARNDPRVASLTDFRFVKPDDEGRIAVDVLVTSAEGMNAVVQKLESLGAVIKAQTPAYRSITTRLRLDDLEPLASMTEVSRLREAVPPRTHR